MKICQFKPKKNLPSIDNLFEFDHPFFGLRLFPEIKQWADLSKDGWCPSLDVSEEKDHFKIQVDLPGVKKDDIEITAEGHVLTITGERKYDEETKEKNYHRVERARGQFVRRLELGQMIDLSKVHAKFKDGVLSIKVDKEVVSSPVKIDIES